MFGNRLATERKRLGFTQKDVGERLGIGRSAVGMIETDHAPLDAERLVNLGSDGFDVLYILSGGARQGRCRKAGRLGALHGDRPAS